MSKLRKWTGTDENKPTKKSLIPLPPLGFQHKLHHQFLLRTRITKSMHGAHRNSDHFARASQALLSIAEKLRRPLQDVKGLGLVTVPVERGSQGDGPIGFIGRGRPSIDYEIAIGRAFEFDCRSAGVEEKGVVMGGDGARDALGEEGEHSLILGRGKCFVWSSNGDE